MDYKAVITGDIVDSLKSMEYRKNLLHVIKDTCDSLSNLEISFDFYRGDGFQILLNRPELAAKVAIIIRCAIKAATPRQIGYKWDARLSIGIGTIEFCGDSISTSDGEVFRFSGRGLDVLKKRRLAINTPWVEFNEDVSVSTAFLDSLITSWSMKKSYLMLKYLTTDLNNKELALTLGESPQNLSKTLKDAQVDNIDLYLEYFKNTVEKHIRE